MKAFSAVILYISGNYAASGKDPEWIADKYDQLIRLIRSNNNDCRIILCSLVPRGDVDVTKMNQIISELATHCKNQRVECTSECYDVFVKGGQLSTRYFSQDGIHLCGSGTKRLLDAINRKCRIVEDFDKCTFNRGNNMLRARVTGDNHRRSQAGQFRNTIAPFRQQHSLLRMRFDRSQSRRLCRDSALLPQQILIQ